MPDKPGECQESLECSGSKIYFSVMSNYAVFSSAIADREETVKKVLITKEGITWQRKKE